MDIIRNAITLHDSQNRPMTGLFTASQLTCLLSHRSHCEVLDPWGNQIWIDANVGVIVSYGRDNHPGGAGEDADVELRYKGRPKVLSTVYDGPPGFPTPDSTLRIRFGKPLRILADPLRDLVLVLDRKRRLVLPLDGGWPRMEPGPSYPTPGDLAHSLGGARWTYDGTASKPAEGELTMRCVSEAKEHGPHVFRFSSTTSVDVRASVVAVEGDGNESSLSVIREAYAPDGPFDAARFGRDAYQTDGAFPSR